MKPRAISIRAIRFGRICELNLTHYRKQRSIVNKVLVDELETFEHTKCKPLTVPIAIEDKTRKILALDIGQIAAKGHLSKIALKKYGYRKCERNKVLNTVFQELTGCCRPTAIIKTDKSQHYPKKIRKHFPYATHKTTKGRRGCVVGQGELKRGGYDPLFFLNHSYAMFRDNLKTLSRRTWCTAKKTDRLRNLLYMYSWFHNLYLDNPRKITLKIAFGSN